ncbi:TATA-binding protein-associated factor 172 [Amphibalanus amphitrite]|uniref:TATA-binding protein-associated factor 172 n=1 Tax=Amphibalanus amphitrite TaxID=1232801 RepID=A0A6A4VZX7_AMPAM|nr:TATA-binding protein-associated factor 172 [Amphibalanus amphitrite]
MHKYRFHRDRRKLRLVLVHLLVAPNRDTPIIIQKEVRLGRNRSRSRVHEYLQSSSWECRIAAGQAVEAIVSNLPQWRPTPASQLTDEVCVPSSSPSPPYLQLTLESFNLDQVLAENPILTSLETADATDDQG